MVLLLSFFLPPRPPFLTIRVMNSFRSKFFRGYKFDESIRHEWGNMRCVFSKSLIDSHVIVVGGTFSH